jgi:hypothetical protein
MSFIKTNQLILYTEITYVFSQARIQHINTLCEEKIEFVNVKTDGELK